MNTRTSHFASEIQGHRGCGADETSHAGGAPRQLVSSFDPSPYRSLDETLAARRRELEAELRALDERARRATSVPERAPTRSVRRAALMTFLALALGASLGGTAAVGVIDLGLHRGPELDAHAELAHRRAAARAFRHERDLELANAARIRDIAAAALAPAPAAVAVRVEPEAPSARSLPMHALDDLELFVTPLGDGIWDVEAAVLRNAFLAPGVRVVPAHEHGRVIGARLYGVRRAGILGRLGFENGDTIVAVNRRALDDGIAALEDPLAGASRAVFAVVRRGAPRTHTYLLRAPTAS